MTITHNLTPHQLEFFRKNATAFKRPAELDRQKTKIMIDKGLFEFGELVSLSGGKLGKIIVMSEKGKELFAALGQ